MDVKRYIGLLWKTSSSHERYDYDSFALGYCF